MRAGTFNIHDYLEKLNEQKEEGGPSGNPKEGIIIPAENKKTYDWLQKEYGKAKTEVKVEMKMGGSKFEPGYEMQAQPDSVNDFKPGVFGQVKSGKKSEKTEKKNDSKKAKGVSVKGAVSVNSKKEDNAE